jgi:hypothetical protein
MCKSGGVVRFLEGKKGRVKGKKHIMEYPSGFVQLVP